MENIETTGNVRLMFQDEAGFGRINKPKYCWCFPGFRPTVPCRHIREYRYAYGAAEPLTGESFFLVLPYANTICMNIFLHGLSEQYPDDKIILVCDGAAWHTTNTLEVPQNIRLIFLPPATPEMNPIEQIWKEIRKKGFRNEAFETLDDVVDRLCETIRSLTASTITSIMGREWIIKCF
jgi:putative transposase